MKKTIITSLISGIVGGGAVYMLTNKDAEPPTTSIQGLYDSDATKGAYNHEGTDEEFEEKVYICTGEYSKCYHCDIDCQGLSNCSADISEITLSEAMDMGRKECHYCY